MSANDNRPQRKPSGSPFSRNRGNAAALVAIVILTATLLWTVSAIQKHNSLQNCIDSGRHDCIEIPQGKTP